MERTARWMHARLSSALERVDLLELFPKEISCILFLWKGASTIIFSLGRHFLLQEKWRNWNCLCSTTGKRYVHYEGKSS